MKVMLTMKEKIWSFVFCFGIFFPLICQAITTPKPTTLVFKSSSILNSLPSKDVQSVYQAAPSSFQLFCQHQCLFRLS